MKNKAIQNNYLPPPFSMTGSLEGMEKGPNFNQGHITPTKGNFKQTLRWWVVLDTHLRWGGGSVLNIWITYTSPNNNKNIMVRSQGDRHRQMRAQGIIPTL